MAKVKISELPSLSPATLDTTYVVGISGSTTYKISINQLTSSLDTTFATDLVTAALSSSLNSKLSTSSYSTDSASFNSRIISGSVVAGTISSSAQITTFGFLSTSTDLSSLNTISASYLSFTQSYYSASASFDSRVDSLENATSSYLTSLNGAISGAGQISDLGFVTGSYTTINSFNNLTQSFNSISQSFTTISGSFGSIDFSGINAITSSYLSFTQSYYSASVSFDNRIDGLENATSSYLTSLNGAISSSAQILDGSGIFSSSAQLPIGLVSGSSQILNSSGIFSSSAQLPNGLISSSTQFPSNLISGSSQISTLGFITGSYVSSSTYTTDSSSFNSRIISGSAVVGTISGSAQITAFGFISSSQTIDSGSLVTTSSFNSYTASLNAFSSSLSVTANSSTKILDAYYTSAAAWSGSYSGNGGTVKVEANFALYSTSIGTKTFTLFRNGIAVDSGSFYFNNTGVHTTMPTLYYIGTNETGTNTYSVGHNAVSDAGDSCNIVVTETFNTLNAGLISGSAQITAFGFISSSQTIDTSSLVTTSSFNSFTSSVNTMSTSVDSRLDTLEATIISGSVNYVQTLGARVTGVTTVGAIIVTGSITTTGNPVQIMVTGDANPTITSWARLQIFRDNTAIGNIVQVENSSNLNVPYCINVIDTPSAGTYTYSMRTVSIVSGQFDFGEHNGPTLTAVELKTNTNLPSTNNTFTGTNTFNGTTTLKGAVNVGTGSGYEGGEILLAYAQGGSTSLTGSSLVVDVYADKLRIFESDGNSRGVYLDLTKQAAGVGSEILTKASGLVNRGIDVTLGNLKARIAATGNISLQLSTVSGTYSVYGSSVYSQGGAAGTTIDGGSPRTISTTPAYLNSGYNFASAGATDTWNIMDTSNSIAWRITMILGAGVNNNLVSIERLH